MKFIVDAACACDIGKRRQNNEDNFFFGGKCLPAENSGLEHTLSFKESAKRGMTLAVFDGMGGENFGELASYAAAKEMQSREFRFADLFTKEEEYISRLVQQLNDKVVEEEVRMRTNRMGTTMVALFFTSRHVLAANVGDSRAYRLREGEFTQLSYDHVDRFYAGKRKKAPLTQHLGIDPEYMYIEPHINKSQLQTGDWYLICSDGLSDMLSDGEIAAIIAQSSDARACADKLLAEALERGGIDNTTIIVCKIS